MICPSCGKTNSDEVRVCAFCGKPFPQGVTLAGEWAEKSPTTALLLSLLFPGIGQIYCGKVKRGVLTSFFFALSALLMFLGFVTEDARGDLFAGIGMRGIIFLYVFAFLDSFFTAHEINSGLDRRIEKNPRVAAILNLLTIGGGYWYLGSRKRAGVMLFSVGLLNRAAIRIGEGLTGILLGLAVEIILVVLAADAYRMARRSLRERLAGRSGEDALESKEMLTLDLDKPSLPPEPQSPAEDPLSIVGGARLPLALGGLFFFGYWTLILLGLLVADYETMDQSQTVTTEEIPIQSHPKVSNLVDGRKIYINYQDGVRVRVWIPEGWEIDIDDPDLLIQSSAWKGGCKVGLKMNSALPSDSLESLVDELIEKFQKEHPLFELKARRSATLASYPAQEVVFQVGVEGGDVIQRYLLAERGTMIFTLVTTIGVGFIPYCGEEMESIRKNLVFEP